MKFDLDVRVNVSSEQAVKQFLSELNTSTGCTFNVMNGRPDKSAGGVGARCGYRGYRKCAMNVCGSDNRKSRQPGKDTKCEASITFRVENPPYKNKNIMNKLDL